MTRKKFTSDKLPRLPAITAYPEDQRNKKIIDKHWRRLMGQRYAFSEVQRILIRQEAERIQKEETASAVAV